jgi:hypothetical protein
MDLVVSDVVAREGGAKEGLRGPPLGAWAFVKDIMAFLSFYYIFEAKQ